MPRRKMFLTVTLWTERLLNTPARVVRDDPVAGVDVGAADALAAGQRGVVTVDLEMVDRRPRPTARGTRCWRPAQSEPPPAPPQFGSDTAGSTIVRDARAGDPDVLGHGHVLAVGTGRHVDGAAGVTTSSTPAWIVFSGSPSCRCWDRCRSRVDVADGRAARRRNEECAVDQEAGAGVGRVCGSPSEEHKSAHGAALVGQGPPVPPPDSLQYRK